jgi:hypothetical protein
MTIGSNNNVHKCVLHLLSVIFEYKLRLEKSVQQEKAEHRHTREELQAHLDEERARRGKEVLEATNKLASMQQHCKLLQV